jgi:hypothetical protein
VWAEDFQCPSFVKGSSMTKTLVEQLLCAFLATQQHTAQHVPTLEQLPVVEGVK